MKAIRLTAAAALFAASTGALASQSDPQDIAFARDGDSATTVVVLTDASLGCKGIQQAYYVMGDGGKVTGSGCYYGYHDAVFAQDVEGAPHRWPLASFKRTDYSIKHNAKIPMARD